MKRKRLLLVLLTLLCFIGGAKAQNELTVYDGQTATSSYLPVYGLWADAYLKGEFVIPAAELTPMSGGTVSKMTFYLATSAEVAWTGTFQVFLKEVSETSISAYSGTEGATIVYEGTLDATGSTMEINFSTNYAYSGGNLLVGVYQIEKGNYKSCKFYGETVDGASVQGYSSASLDEVTTTQRNFIPQTTFTYTGGTAPFNKPTNIVVDPLQAKTATISWTAPVGAVTGYFYQYKEATMPEDDYEDNEASTTATSVSLTGLTPNTAYNFRVKAIYSDGESTYAIKNFTTPVSCPAPTDLAVTATTATSATLNWTENGDATSWQICLNGDEDNLIAANSNPFTLTGLTAGTEYSVKVRAVGSGEYSAWTSVVSFVTSFCSEEDQCLITLDLTDSYSDGWNGNAIQVVDAETSVVLGTYTLTSGGSGSFTLAVCPGREINFVWVKGLYPGETSWVIKDVNDEVITSGTGTASMATGDVLATYLVDCSVLPSKPTDLATSAMTYNSATLTWTENGTASAWEICLNGNMNGFVVANSNPFTLTGLTEDTEYNVKVRAVVGSERSNWSDAINFTTPEQFPKPADFAVSSITFNSAELSWTGSADSYDVRYGVNTGGGFSWLKYDDGTLATNIGAGGSFYWAVMFPGGTYTGETLTKVANYDVAEMTGTVFVLNDGDTAPSGSVIGTKDFEFTGSGEFVEVAFDSPLAIDNSKNLWVVFYQASGATHPAAACADAGDANARWASLDGSDWFDLVQAVPGYSWMIRAYTEAELDGITWTTQNAITENTYQLTGLTEATNYVAQVRANYGTDQSAWNTTGFTTPAANPIPTVTNVETTRTSATIEWTGASDSYKLKYRTAEVPSYFTDFEHGLPEGWTTIDADNDGYTWAECGEVGIFTARSGNNCVTSASYINNVGALTPDNWLVSPKLTLNGTVKAWLKGQDASYAAEHFAIYVSTTGTDVADFTEVLGETIATGNYVQYAADLSSYAGQQGYIAIRHFNCTDQFWLNLDDFGLYTGATPGAWTEVATTETSVELTGLTEDTEYEFTVIGVKNGEENAGSELASFTPRASSILLYDNGGENTNLISKFDGTVADVTLRNRTLFKDDSWNTLCLPFNLTIAGSVLDGATAKTLTNATMTGTTVEFDFGEAVETLQAGVPYIIKWASGENIVNPVFTDVTINKSTTGQTISKADGNVKFIGYYAPFDIDETDEDIFYMTEDNTLMCTGTDRTLKAFRAYFQLSEAATSREFVLNFGDEATGINAPTISVDNDAWYTIDGRKLDKKPVTKGLYIHNGKKFVIK